MRTAYLSVILTFILVGAVAASWAQVSPDDPGIIAEEPALSEEPAEPPPAEEPPPEEPPAEPVPPATQPPVTPTPVQAGDQPPTAASVRLEDISWSEEGRIGKLFIRTDAPVTNFRAFSGKNTIAVDLWRAHNAEWRTELLAHEYARRLRVRQYTPELARIYIDLKKPARYKTFIKSDPHGLTVLVIPPWMATTKLPPSVAYVKIRVPSGRGSSAVHILRVDPAASDIVIRPVLAGDVSTGTETTSVIATRYDALAGINGGYFAGAGRPLGMIVIDGELVSAPLSRRSVFAIATNGRPFIQSFEFQGHIKTPDNKRLWISAVNRTPHQSGVAVYTSHYGPLTPYLQTAAVVRSGVVVGYYSGRILIPQNGYVLTVNQSDELILTNNLKPGQRAEIVLNIDPATQLISAIGGGPRLVKDGKAFVPFVWEWFTSALFATREPRTAVGILPNGKLIFVTVDGRSKQNTGMTLTELSRLMVTLGAIQAMNLDGGSSATMVVGGRIVNEPSAGEERPVGSALLILRATPSPISGR